MKAASQAGYRLVVALDLAALWDEEICQELALLDADIVLTDEADDRGESLLATLLADRKIRMSPAARRRIAAHLWSTRRRGASNHARGRRFEALVSFLLSQVSDFEVRERNLRAATDEVDAVVQLRSIAGRCWCESGVPFILVEAKNYERDKVGQAEVSLLITKLETRRGRARIGILMSATGFSSDAEDQELKFALSDLTTVLVGPDEIREWIDAEDIDDCVERIVSRAMLR